MLTCSSLRLKCIIESVAEFFIFFPAFQRGSAIPLVAMTGLSAEGTREVSRTAKRPRACCHGNMAGRNKVIDMHPSNKGTVFPC